MLRPISIAAVATALFVSATAEAMPARSSAALERSAERLDATSTWIIAASVVGLLALILFLDDSEDDLVPVSP